MKTTSRFALAAATGLFVGAMAFTPAKAADLGGDCCADLEERVAELEATTVRKGNRVVSVELYGQVNKALMFWDDGVDSDVFVVDSDMSSTRLGLRGTGQLTAGSTVGYHIEFDIQNQDSASTDQTYTDQGSDEFDMRHANLYIEGAYGRVTLGLQSEATDGAAYANLGGTLTASDGTYGGQFSIMAEGFGGTGATWNDLLVDGDGGRKNLIRYDSPSLAGFILSASWGEDDSYDVALRFSKEWNSIRMAAAVGYRHTEDDFKEFEAIGDPESESDTIVGSASVMHVPSGVFVFASASDTETDDTSFLGNATYDNIFGLLPVDSLPADELDQRHWYTQAGINRNWTGYGSTRVYGEYGQYETDVSLTGGGDLEIDTDVWGAGVEQDFDSAATTVYMHYRHNEVDADDIEALDMVVTGARIKF